MLAETLNVHFLFLSWKTSRLAKTTFHSRCNRSETGFPGKCRGENFSFVKKKKKNTKKWQSSCHISGYKNASYSKVSNTIEGLQLFAIPWEPPSLCRKELKRISLGFGSLHFHFFCENWRRRPDSFGCELFFSSGPHKLPGCFQKTFLPQNLTFQCVSTLKRFTGHIRQDYISLQYMKKVKIRFHLTASHRVWLDWVKKGKVKLSEVTYY